MSLTLVENPVVTESGIVKNLFAGFDKVEYKFKREDLQITSVGQGISNQVLITIGADLSSYLSIGDFVYLYAEGDNYTYDDTGQIVAITSSTITIDLQFIETADDGYINYYKNYYLEVQLVNENNSDINILPFSLKDDGDNAGNINIDVSIANDKNIQYFDFVFGELEDSRIIFKVKYREVWDVSDNEFTVLNERIVLVYATQQPELEQFINELEEPKLWKGYPYGVNLTHTKDNKEDEGINIKYDELDINQNTITSDNNLGSFDSNDEGFLFNNIDKDISYDSDTEYIELKAAYGNLPQYNPAQYNNTQYNVS